MVFRTALVVVGLLLSSAASSAKQRVPSHTCTEPQPTNYGSYRECSMIIEKHVVRSRMVLFSKAQNNPRALAVIGSDKATRNFCDEIGRYFSARYQESLYPVDYDRDVKLKIVTCGWMVLKPGDQIPGSKR